MTPEQREQLKLKAEDILDTHGVRMTLDQYCRARDEFASLASPEAVLSLIAQVEALTVPQWIVNDMAELGVKIGDQFFFLYKGDNIEYESGLHDDGTPIKWREVGKSEFGEVCHPVKFWKPGARLPKRYTDELVFTPGLSFGAPGDADWKDLPTIPAIPGTKEGA